MADDIIIERKGPFLNVTLNRPIPVYLHYLTAGVDGDERDTTRNALGRCQPRGVHARSAQLAPEQSAGVVVSDSTDQGDIVTES